MSPFIALIHKEPGSDYGVSFPDLPGCVTAGRTLDDARAAAVEALALHLEGMIEDGDAIPAPSALEDIMQSAENRSGVAILVDSPKSAGVSVRVNITLPQDVLDAIDKTARKLGMTRSGYIARAAKKDMAA